MNNLDNLIFDLPVNLIFELSVNINGPVRKYECYSIRFAVDETLIIAYIARVINRQAPFDFNLKITECNGNDRDHKYLIEYTVNGRSNSQTISFYHLHTRFIIDYISSFEPFKSMDREVIRDRLDIVRDIMNRK